MFRLGKRRGESGNVFFTLFGAVAMVGVVGIATSTLMRGPVGTVVSLNQKAKADAQLQIARKLTGLASAGNSCDADTFIEPLPADATCAQFPVGGGCLPTTVGAARLDPWGTAVGYCGWDHGQQTAGCGGLLQGSNVRDRPVLAVISAGADRTFQTSCANHPGYVTTAGDDVVWEWTYDEAAEGLGGGLWKLKSAGVIAPEDDVTQLDLSVDTAFSSGMTAAFRDNSSLQFDAGTSLDLSSGGLFTLPDETDLPNCTAAADSGLLRRYVGGGGQVLQICDPPPSGPGWADIGGSGASNQVAGAEGDIQFNSGGELYAMSSLNFNKTTNTLAVGSGGTAINASGGITASGAVSVGGALTVAGDISDSNSGVNIADDLSVSGTSALTGNTTVGGTLGVTGATSLSSLGATGAVDFDSTLNVDGATTLGNTLSVSGDIQDPNSEVTINDTLKATGAVDFDSSLNVDGDSTLDMVGATSYEITSIGSGEGMFTDGAGGINFRTGGLAAMQIDSAGDIGISLGGTPTVDLDIGGVIRLRMMGETEGSTCNSLFGAITYSSGDKLLVCSNLTGNWEAIGTSGGGGGNVGGVWDDNNGYISYENSSFIVDEGDDIQFKSAMKGLGTRFLWYPTKKSMRVGEVNGTQWDDPQIGTNSMALGQNLIAQGANSIALGEDVSALASNSMAIGLGDPAGAAPVVNAANSLGIFMGDQSGLTMGTANTFGVFGGQMILDNAGPVQTAATAGLLLDVEGDVGAVQYCSEDRTYCFTSEDVATGNLPAPNGDNEVIFSSGGFLWSEPAFSYTSAGRLGIGTATPLTRLDVAGSIKLSNGGETCAASLVGAVRYESTGDSVEFCSDNGGTPAWVSLSTGGTFLELTDTPDDYTGEGGKLVRVNTAEDALEFTDVIIETVVGQPPPDLLNLDDLNDVAASSPVNGDCLVYDNVSGKWENGSCDGGAGAIWRRGATDDIYYNSGANPRVAIGITAPVTDIHISKPA